MYPLNHSNGKIDYRYEITSEHDDIEVEIYTLRFCGDYITSDVDIESLVLRAEKHNEERFLN